MIFSGRISWVSGDGTCDAGRQGNQLDCWHGWVLGSAIGDYTSVDVRLPLSIRGCLGHVQSICQGSLTLALMFGELATWIVSEVRRLRDSVDKTPFVATGLGLVVRSRHGSIAMLTGFD